MSCVVDASSKPLPVVLRPARDELLSSWLARHARFYGVTGPFFAKWLGLGDIRLLALDHRLSLGQVARLTDKFRCDPVTLINMTHIDTRDGQVCNLISRGRAAQICYPCADRYAREDADGAVPKHWSKAWRITCPVCGLAFTDTSEHRGSRATLLETSPFEDQWSEALVGEQIIEQHAVDEKPPNTPRLQSCGCCWFRLGSQSQATLSALSSDGCWVRFSQILTCARDRSSGASRTRRSLLFR